MMGREDYVAHRIGGILYETWSPRQIQFIAELSCSAVDEWQRMRSTYMVEALPTRRDHTVAEARAYRDGIEDSIDCLTQIDRETGEW